MPVHAAEPHFACGQLKDRPCLRTIREFLQPAPDQAIDTVARPG
jgi:hypothetical protein